MKNRIEYSCKKLTKKLHKSIPLLNDISKQYNYSEESFNLLNDIARLAYAQGSISESEFISFKMILGKTVSDFNSRGFIEKSIIWFFAETISDS